MFLNIFMDIADATFCDKRFHSLVTLLEDINFIKWRLHILLDEFESMSMCGSALSLLNKLKYI